VQVHVDEKNKELRTAKSTYHRHEHFFSFCVKLLAQLAALNTRPHAYLHQC
jgi:hypothetical protein